jgi:hypothetical protein
MMPPEVLKQDLRKALWAQDAIKSLTSSYKPFKVTPPPVRPVIDPSVLNSITDIRQEAFNKALASLREQNLKAIHNIVNEPARIARQTALGRILNDTETWRRIVPPTQQDWLQSALRDARAILTSPQVRPMFVDPDSLQDLLAQAESIEADAAEAQAQLPPNIDEETFLGLDITTLLFIVNYFNSVVTVLMVVLMVSTFGEEQSQMLTNIEDACQIAKGITELALLALKRKANNQDKD